MRGKRTPPGRRARPFARALPAAGKALLERKQELVRDALAKAAEALFLAQGFEATTVEQIAAEAGLSRRSFFRYFESKEDVLARRADELGERFYAALAARPTAEPPLVAIRNALVPAIAEALRDADVVRCTIRLLRETNGPRQVVLARANRLEERVAALMMRRLRTGATDNTPMLLAFLTRALLDTAFNAWYDHETADVAALVDELIRLLRGLVVQRAPGARRETRMPASE